LVESKRTFKGWESGWYQSWRRGLRDASPSREGEVGGPSLLIQWFPWEIEKLDHFRLFPDGARPIRLTSFTLFSLSCYSNGLPLPSHQTDGALIHSPQISHSLLHFYRHHLSNILQRFFFIGITEFCGKISNRVSNHTKRI